MSWLFHIDVQSLAVGLALATVVTAIISWSRRCWRRKSASLRARRQGARAVAGEHDAEQLLIDYGFEIIDRQVPLTWVLAVDGEPVPIDLRVDLIVSRRGRHYVAEVKTGRYAPCISNAATRRQLLEYRLAYDVGGALLVDVEASEVQEIEFPAFHPDLEYEQESSPYPLRASKQNA